MNPIQKRIDATSKQMDKLIGQPAVYTSRVFGDINSDNQQSVTNTSCQVKVRSMPLSIRDLTELSKAGIHHVETRWVMRSHYMAEVNPGDLISICGLNYEVAPNPPSVLDELGIEWTIYTRRLRA